jgi:LPXTG-site transpeptidase (sortase) family protein
MNINRHAIIALSIVLSACSGQAPPVISTLEENTIIGVPSATPSSQPLPLLSATPQSSMEPTLTAEEIIPITAPTQNSDSESIPITTSGSALQPPNNANPDKFQDFEIPVIGGSGNGGQFSLVPTTGFPPGVISRIRTEISLTLNKNTPSLVIPSLDVNIPIYGVELRNGTWDVSWLWDQAGWLEGTAYPTSNGNSAITAHVVTADGEDGPFARLKFLTSDDYVFIVNSGYRYIYKVDSINYIKPDDVSVLSPEENSWLTLITCDSYDEQTKEYLLRVVVRTKLVEIQETIGE